MMLLAGVMNTPASSFASPVAAASPSMLRPAHSQELAMLLSAHAVRKEAGRSGNRLAIVAAHRPITGARTVLPVLSRKSDSAGRTWLRVRLPGRVLNASPHP